MDSKDQVRQRVRTYLSQARGIPENKLPGSEVSLLQEGLIDSLGMMDLVSFLEETFKVSVSDDDLIPDNFESFDAIAAFVTRNQTA